MNLPATISGEGPNAIIQGPGWGPASEYLRLTLVPLLGALRVLTYDVRNTGRAPRQAAPDSQSLECLAADLEQVRLARGFERFLLFGHSHGSAIAAAYAIRHQTHLRGLVLISPGLEDPGASPEAARLLEEYARDPRRADAVRWFKKGWRDTTTLQTDGDLARWMRGRMPVNFHDLEAMHRFQRRLRHAPSPSIDALRGIPLEREDWVEQGLPSIHVPTLVLVGQQDVTTPVAQATQIAGLIPGAQLVVLDRAGHNPWCERPAEFSKAIERFVGYTQTVGAWDAVE